VNWGMVVLVTAVFVLSMGRGFNRVWYLILRLNRGLNLMQSGVCVQTPVVWLICCGIDCKGLQQPLWMTKGFRLIGVSVWLSPNLG
jgi:hypothetical protein